MGYFVYIWGVRIVDQEKVNSRGGLTEAGKVGMFSRRKVPHSPTIAKSIIIYVLLD